MANIILDVLPETVEIDGAEYRINSDFRISILFELLMQDDEVGKRQKLIQGLKLYYPEIPQNMTEAVEKMIWFYRCGKETESGGHGSGSGRAKQIYSFEHDDDYIYAAFLEQYGIDLQDVEELHWWKFRALFRGLSEDTEFVKIMGYRSVKITSKMSKEQREFYKKMQSIHALPITDAERKADELLTEALLNGGDITGLV
jgi:hypothetical protein